MQPCRYLNLNIFWKGWQIFFCVLRSRADVEHLFPIQPNKHVVRHKLAVRQKIMLANNHALLYCHPAPLACLNQPDWVFKTGQCTRVPRRDQGRLHIDVSLRRAAAQIHLDQVAELVLSKQ